MDDVNYENKNYDYYIEGKYDNMVGGFLEGFNNRKIQMTPDAYFNLDLLKTIEFLDEYIQPEDINKIRNVVDMFNYKIFKNPQLIVISYIVVKNSNWNIDVNVFNKIFNNSNVAILIKEHNITQYDLLRYCRFISNTVVNH